LGIPISSYVAFNSIDGFCEILTRIQLLSVRLKKQQALKLLRNMAAIGGTLVESGIAISDIVFCLIFDQGAIE
jgi:hypothetical protein